MFFQTHNTTPPRQTAQRRQAAQPQAARSAAGPAGRAGRAIAAGLDIAIDFATLGEYRLVFDEIATTHDSRPAQQDIWATEIEWSSVSTPAVPERTRAACSLPRARNRDWARSRIQC